MTTAASHFRTQSYGKWILAGEHAVLRGSPALVFPLASRSMKLEFFQENQPLLVTLSGPHGSELEPLFEAVLERACDLMRVPRTTLSGRLMVESSLPIGAGLGASAAFCVIMTRWFCNRGFIQAEGMADFARTLENLFHGESSGVDIAVALSGQGLHFERDGKQFAMVPRWTPHWYISYTGQRGVTSDAVQKVKALISKRPLEGRRLDFQMSEAVSGCERALSLSEAEGLPLLAQSIQKAADCFKEWGLSEGLVDQHLRVLRESGALAVKPTGSGGGGFALSLWSEPPPESLKDLLIPCS